MENKENKSIKALKARVELQSIVPIFTHDTGDFAGYQVTLHPLVLSADEVKQLELDNPAHLEVEFK